MKKCFCGNIIPANRRKYCSVKCIKQAWYIGNTKNRHSFLKKDPLFWNTETGKGFFWEKWVASLIHAKHLEFNNTGCDLDWFGKKVDVKSCELYKRKNKRGKHVVNQSGWWTFNRNKDKSCDFFVCVCLLENKPVKVLQIPAKKFPISGCAVGWKSSYDKYSIDF